MLPGKDGGYILIGTYLGAGNSNQGFVVKTDDAGIFSWSRMYYGDFGASVEFNDIDYSDGGYVLVGKLFIPSSPETGDGLLLKIDIPGNIVWSRLLSNDLCTGCKEEAYSVTWTGDGGCAITGKITTTMGMGKPFLIKADLNGDVSWFAMYEKPGFVEEYGARSVRETSDGGYAFVISDQSTSVPNAIMLKTASDGTPQWATEYGRTGTSQRFCTVNEVYEGGYILAGIDDGADYPTVYMVKTDDAGVSGCNEVDLSYSVSGGAWLPQSALVSDSGAFGALTPFIPTYSVPFIDVLIDCECCGPNCDDLAPWGDANDDGIALSVSDMIYLNLVILGHEPLLSGCGSEMDAYRNPAFPCSPTIGDIIAYQNFFIHGIGALPPQECICPKIPENTGIVMVVPSPLTLSGSSGSQVFTVSLINTSADDYDILGVAVPIDFNSVSGPASVGISLQNYQTYGVWTETEHDPAYFGTERWSGMLLGQTAPASVPLYAGQQLDLFEIYVSWTGGGSSPTTVTPVTFDQAPSFVPTIVAVPTVKSGPDATYPFMLADAHIRAADVPGDANNDGNCNVGDAVYLINYVFKGGPEPPCKAEGDANGDCNLNVGDAVYLISYVFNEGDPPITNDICEWPD